MQPVLRTLVPVLRTLVIEALIFGGVTWARDARRGATSAPPMQPAGSRPAGATVIVVFIPVDQTLGFFHHAFILFFSPDDMRTPHGAYKTEALGGGSRNVVGLPSLLVPRAPHPVTASAELAMAAKQDCYLPAYLFPPWASCSWQDFSIVLQTRMSVTWLRDRFAQTARCLTAQAVPYGPFGPNTNTYAYTALLNADFAHPGAAPSVVAAPGWGAAIRSACTRR